MEIQFIPISSIEAENSMFRMDRELHLSAKNAVLKRVLVEQGFREPLLVWRDKRGRLHLVKEFLMFSLARSMGMESFPCVVLCEKLSVKEVLDIIFLGCFEYIVESTIRKVRFVSMAIRLQISEEEISGRWLPQLGWEAHPEVVKRLKAVGELPEEILDFCHEKRFSLKQCFHLTTYPQEVLGEIFRRRQSVSLTASILDELVMNLGEYLEREGLEAPEFFKQPEIAALFFSEQGPQERTVELRQIVLRLRYPVLTAIHKKVERAQHELGLPPNVEISWDPSLEDESFELKVRILNRGDMEAALEKLMRPVTLERMQTLLDELRGGDDERLPPS